MSDLHGCYDLFIKMLETIDFKDTDELYILGDIFDRGDKSIEILDYVVTHKNITLLKGNHEQMFLDYFENNDVYLWYCNGGNKTHNQILNRDFMYEESIYKYLKKLPHIKIVDNFILVHAGLYFPDNCDYLDLDQFIKLQDEDICLWTRENIDYEKKYKDYTVICGHTPVQTIHNNNDNVGIIQRYGTFYIDCGCVFTKANGKLACLRLNDMKDFYVS